MGLPHWVDELQLAGFLVLNVALLAALVGSVFKLTVFLYRC